MRRRHASIWMVLVIGLLAVMFSACGGSSSSTESSSPAPSVASLSPQEIITQSNAAMEKVKSASFTADMAMTIKGDTTKLEDPTAQALLGKGVTVHAEGASASDPVAVDMDISLSLGEQVLDLSLLAKGEKIWVGYQDQWYKVDQEDAGSLAEQTKEGATPTEQLKNFGIDPEDWGTEYTLVGVEKAADGTDVYHVKATADPQKLADALIKAANDPDLAKALGDEEAAELKKALKENSDDTATLGKSLKDVAVDYWIGVDDMLMRKAQFAAVMDMTGQKDMQGVEGVTLDMSMTMTDFNEPVSVEAPANAKSFDKLMEQMFGGMMSGV